MRNSTYSKDDSDVPGTIKLVDVHESDIESKKSTEVILHPKPSSHPDDPLRWSKSKKESQFILLTILALFECIATVWNGPVWNLWVEELNCTYSQLNTASGVQFIFIAVGCIVLQAVASKIGKRAVYLICTLLQVISPILIAQAKNVAYVTVANGITGFSSAPMFSLIEISSVDMFFQHERGTKVSYVIFALYGGVALGPLVTGFISQGIGWRWAAYILTIVNGVLFLVSLVMLEDTTFTRENDDSEEYDSESLNETQEENTKKLEIKISGRVKSSEENVDDDVESGFHVNTGGKSYLKRMNPIQTKYAEKRSFFWLIFKPLCLLIMPNNIFSGILQAEQQMWLTFMVNTQAEFFSSPPYNFSTAIVGLTNASVLVGTILGMYYGGTICDKIALWLSRRNNGIFEPEFRLWVMIVPTILNAGGLLAYGLGPAYGTKWPIPVVLGEGLLGFTMSSVTGIGYVYCTDSYPNFREDGIASISFLNNAVVTVFSFFINRWMEASGLKLMVWFLFMISLIINGFSLFFILFGKRLRWYTKGLYSRLSVLGEYK